MPGFIEPADFVLRIGKDCRNPGDPYTWACSLKKHKPGIVEVMGVDKPLTPYERREIRTVLRAEGFRKAFYVRVHEGRKRVIILTR